MYNPESPQVQINLDWISRAIDGRMILQIQINKNQMDIPIDLNRLDPLSQQQYTNLLSANRTRL
jgi:hypothetical protein